MRGGARLLISTPPQHAKSTTVAERLPVWIFDRDPGHRILATSYSENLGKRAVRRVRDLSTEHADKLRYRISESKASETHFEVLAADGSVPGIAPGYMKGAGILGSITGDGYDTVIVDDLYKGPEEAYSARHREKVEEAIEAVLMTRLSARGNVIVIMTRWHYDDAIGVRLRRENSEWESLVLPALAEDGDILGRRIGEPLWPDMKPLSFLESQRAGMHPRRWAALYQGNPTQTDGAMFARGWFPIVDQVPALVKRRIRYWDPAASRRQDASDPDYAVGVLMSEMREDLGLPFRWLIEDVVRLRGRPAEVHAAIHRTAQRDGRSVPVKIEQEPGSESALYIETLRNTILLGHSVEACPHGTDKLTRAKPFSEHAEVGNVAVLRAPWNGAFFDELEVFPDERHHDDQVDAATGAWEALSVGSARFPWLEAHAARGHGTMSPDDSEDRSPGVRLPGGPEVAPASPVLSRATGGEFGRRLREGLSSLR